jgi:hypothetical protein
VYEKEMDSRNTNRRLSICQIAVKPFDITTWKPEVIKRTKR